MSRSEQDAPGDPLGGAPQGLEGRVHDPDAEARFRRGDRVRRSVILGVAIPLLVAGLITGGLAIFFGRFVVAGVAIAVAVAAFVATRRLDPAQRSPVCSTCRTPLATFDAPWPEQRLGTGDGWNATIGFVQSFRGADGEIYLHRCDSRGPDFAYRLKQRWFSCETCSSYFRGHSRVEERLSHDDARRVFAAVGRRIDES